MISLSPLEPAPGPAPAACPFHRGVLPPAEEPRAPTPTAYPVEAEAHRFLELMHREGTLPSAVFAQRLAEVRDALAAGGTYRHTAEELEFGARVAWRNSAKCIGRLYWQKLKVRDQRHASTAREVFDALVEHIRIATNGASSSR